MEVVVDERKIWWIASYPKSGNTWVRMFLNAYVSGFPLDMNSGFQFAMGDNHPGLWGLIACRAINELTATEQIFTRPNVLQGFFNISATKHLCLKTHHAKVLAEGIPLIPPKLSAGGVYIIRDPRDVVISFADHQNKSIDTMVEYMCEKSYVLVHNISKLLHILTTWSIHVETWVDKNKDIPITVVRYEDMLNDTENVFRKILKALGFSDINEDKFTFALEQTQFKNLQILEEKNGFTEKAFGKKFFRVGKAGQWEAVLTKQQVEKIEQNHGEMMKKYGYEASTIVV